MRMWFSVFIAAVMLVGCAQMEIQKNIRTLNRIQLGDSQESVFDAMGLPDLQQDLVHNGFQRAFSAHKVLCRNQ